MPKGERKRRRRRGYKRNCGQGEGGEGEKEVPEEEEGDTRGPPFSSLPPRLKFNGMPPPLLAERGKRVECTELPPQKKEPGSAIVDSAEEGCGGRIGLNCHCLQPPTTIRRRAGPPAVHCSLSSSPPPCCAKKERVHSNLCPATTSSPPSWLAFAGFCGGGSCGSSLCFAIGAFSHHTPFLRPYTSLLPRGEFVVTLQFSLSSFLLPPPSSCALGIALAKGGRRWP